MKLTSQHVTHSLLFSFRKFRTEFINGHDTVIGMLVLAPANHRCPFIAFSGHTRWELLYIWQCEKKTTSEDISAVMMHSGLPFSDHIGYIWKFDKDAAPEDNCSIRSFSGPLFKRCLWKKKRKEKASRKQHLMHVGREKAEIVTVILFAHLYRKAHLLPLVPHRL